MDSVQLIGRRVLTYREFSDGSRVLERETFRKHKPAPESVQGIWLSDSGLTFQQFYDIAADHGNLIERENTWPGGSISILETYAFLTEAGCVKSGLNHVEIFAAWSGSFQLPKVTSPRALQGRQRNHVEHRNHQRKRQAFREYLENLFFSVRSIANEQNPDVI